MVNEYFTMNDLLWQIQFVNPSSYQLIDRTGKLRVATTDFNELTVYLSANLRGDFLMTVFIHE